MFSITGTSKFTVCDTNSSTKGSIINNVTGSTIFDINGYTGLSVTIKDGITIKQVANHAEAVINIHNYSELIIDDANIYKQGSCRFCIVCL